MRKLVYASALSSLLLGTTLAANAADLPPAPPDGAARTCRIHSSTTTLQLDRVLYRRQRWRRLEPG